MSPEGRWLDWQREAMPASPGTRQRPAEGVGGTRGESENGGHTDWTEQMGDTLPQPPLRLLSTERGYRTGLD